MKMIKNMIFRIMVKRLAKPNILSVPELVELPAKRFIGYSITTTIKNNQQKEDIPPFYHEVYDNGKLEFLKQGAELNMYCIFDMHKNQQDFDYYVVVEETLVAEGKEYARIESPAGKFIKVEFLKRNNKTVNMVMMYIRKIWMAKYGFAERNAQPFIVYDERFHSNFRKFGCKGDDYLGSPIATMFLPVDV